MPTRRESLKQSAIVAGLLASTGLFPGDALAYTKTAFDAKNVADAVKAVGGGAPAESRDVSITAPEIADNGAVVPIAVATTLAGIKHMLILVEKNPNALVAKFDVTEAVEPGFSIRTKMGESSAVYAVVITQDGKALFAKRDVKVTLGGCG